jgi:arylsulfatase A-like enzyme
MTQQPIDIGVQEIRDEKLAAYPRQAEEMRQHLADYYACVTSLDYHLSRILQKLQDQKRLDDTIIVFSSDQGLAVGGRHGHMGKQNLYEHFKSPLIIAGPGVPHGRSPALVYLFDLYPTTCELVGIPVPKECDGISLIPILRGEKAAVRDTLFAVYMDTQRMVRTDQWKLLWYPKIDQFQLFNLQSDPNELNNLAQDPQWANQFNEMKSRMAAQQDLFGDNKAPKVK